MRDRLFRLELNCYVVAVQHSIGFLPSSSRRVISAFWAETEGAALRAEAMEIEADEAAPGLKMPPEMLLPGGARTYGDILAAFKTGKHGTFLERADYRIARDGAFIHRVIDGPVLKFYFRGLAEVYSEIPYAIERRLEGLKGAK